MPGDDGQGSDSDFDVQAVRAWVGATASGGHHLPQVQVEALERAEVALEAGPPRADNTQRPLTNQPEHPRSSGFHHGTPDRAFPHGVPNV